jgi:hypothetical protein
MRSWTDKGAIPCVVARVQNRAHEPLVSCRSLPKRSIPQRFATTPWQYRMLYETFWIALLCRQRQNSITSIHEVKEKLSELRGGNPLVFLVDSYRSGSYASAWMEVVGQRQGGGEPWRPGGNETSRSKIMDQNAKMTLPLETCGLDYSL